MATFEPLTGQVFVHKHSSSDLTGLEDVFVDLASTQVITGQKTLTAGLTVTGGDVLLKAVGEDYDFKVAGKSLNNMIHVRKFFDRIGFGTTGTVDYPFHVGLEAKFESGVQIAEMVAIGDAGLDETKLLNIDKSLTNASSDNYGFFSVLRVDSPTTSDKNFYGGFIQAQTKSGNAQNYTGILFGQQVFAEHNGSGLLDEAVGAEYKVQIFNGSLGIAQALRTYAHAEAGTTVTTNIGLLILKPLGGGTRVNNYGLLVQDQHIATTYNVGIELEGTGVQNALEWAYDTRLYRGYAGGLYTDGDFILNGNGKKIWLGEFDCEILHTGTHFQINNYSGELQLNGSNDGGIRLLGKVGFYNTTPVTQQTLKTGVGATVDDVITALQNLGLVTQ